MCLVTLTFWPWNWCALFVGLPVGHTPTTWLHNITWYWSFTQYIYIYMDRSVWRAYTYTDTHKALRWWCWRSRPYYTIVTDPTIWQPGFDLPRQSWFLPNQMVSGQVRAHVLQTTQARCCQISCQCMTITASTPYSGYAYIRTSVGGQRSATAITTKWLKL